MTAGLEVEQSLLGACLINPEVMDVIDGIVSREDFSEALHMQIYDIMHKARAEGRKPDVTLLRSMLGELDKTQLGNKTVGEYLAALVHNTPTVLNAPDYARLVSEHASYRRLSLAGKMLEQRSRHDGQSSPSEIAMEVIGELDAIASAGLSEGARRVSMSDAARCAFDAMLERKEHGVSRGVTWGVSDLDKSTLGLHAGELTILAARPSMGKTTMGLSVALAAARSGTGVLFVSLEMGAEALGERALASMAHRLDVSVPYTRIRAGDVDERELWALEEAAKHLQNLPMMIEQQAGLSVSQIISRARTAAGMLKRNAGPGLGLLIIDHLGLVKASDRYPGARHLELGEITAALKAAAKELSVPVLLLCQLSRAVESRENKRPQLSDLRESGRIEEDADNVLMLFREAYYLERQKETDPDKDNIRVERLIASQNIIEINIAKQRQGETRVVEAYVNMPCNVVTNLSRRG